MARGARIRLDELVLSRGLAPSRTAARALIMAGLVLVSGEVSDKAGTLVDPAATISVKERPRFVSRAGDKLDAALETFGVDVAGASALDVGASTGGFVDCLLQRGADAGHRPGRRPGTARRPAAGRPESPRWSKGSTRAIWCPSRCPGSPDLLTMDVSFISVTKVLPAVVCLPGPAHTRESSSSSPSSKPARRTWARAASCAISTSTGASCRRRRGSSSEQVDGALARRVPVGRSGNGREHRVLLPYRSRWRKRPRS